MGESLRGEFCTMPVIELEYENKYIIKKLNLVTYLLKARSLTPGETAVSR
jgi:hypothetical protein